ncbi:MAG TPA: hypothetical protein VHT02_06025 [Methylocella sp.]|jgi:hypothetical protein|nr:hypothetical protein [Methylocella sp.]
MRILCLFVFVALALGLPGPVRAQVFPPDKLLAGDVKLAVGATKFGGSCYVNRGSSLFQRNGASTKAVISFDEIVDSAIWELRGQAVMTFTTTTSGAIHFKRTPTVPPTISDPSFLNYTQTYDPVGQRLVVSFNIAFPDCSLPVFATFDTVQPPA